jgi:flagellar biosynthesis anti-sigma factor FlgM
MRIDNNNSGNNALGQTARAAETQPVKSAAKGEATSATPSDGDALQLSRFAGTISEVLQSDSTRRAQRVAQLQASVESGTYEVDGTAVSQALTDQAISPGSKPK